MGGQNVNNFDGELGFETGQVGWVVENMKEHKQEHYYIGQQNTVSCWVWWEKEKDYSCECYWSLQQCLQLYGDVKTLKYKYDVTCLNY